MPFESNQIGLTRIETRPARSGDWSVFSLSTLMAMSLSPMPKQPCAASNDIALEVRVLGSYPKATGQE